MYPDPGFVIVRPLELDTWPPIFSIRPVTLLPTPTFVPISSTVDKVVDVLTPTISFLGKVVIGSSIVLYVLVSSDEIASCNVGA